VSDSISTFRAKPICLALVSWKNTILRLLLLFAVTGLVTGASSDPVPAPEYRLRLFHTHTNERIDVVYRRGQTYDSEAMAKLDRFLRDHRTGEVHRFNPQLFDLLADLTQATGRPGAELHVICGFRTKWSNEFLRRKSTGVAQNSLHMQADAIDIRLPGMKTSDFRMRALSLGRGGVGYYPQSNFIHVDVGRVRRW
jgi:uncharacterized protein YcbK (DUF882 family)